MLEDIAINPIQSFNEILGASVEERLTYFHHKTVAHGILKSTHDQLLEGIRHPNGISLIVVYGPTGVGKTTLRLRVQQQLIDDAMLDPTTHVGHIPVVGVEAIASETGNFAWKDYFKRALLALNEPLVDQKVNYNVQGTDHGEKISIERAMTAADLRRVLESTLAHRRPRAFIVDEAQHFGRVTSARRVRDHMDTLKSISNLSNTVHVLLGTYELLDLLSLNGQLTRRTLPIHFPRYRIDRVDDVIEFRRLIRSLAVRLPFHELPDLEEHFEFLYERSLGCIGILKTLLTRALAMALRAGESTLTYQHLEACAEPPRRLNPIMREILAGEQAVNNHESDYLTLRAMMGLGTLPSPALSRSASTKKNNVPGKRNPVRDKVGRQNGE